MKKVVLVILALCAFLRIIYIVTFGEVERQYYNISQHRNRWNVGNPMHESHSGICIRKRTAALVEHRIFVYPLNLGVTLQDWQS